MQNYEHGYSGYFARRVGEQPLFGEVTSAYSLIGEAGFRYLKQLFPRTKVIYLMRDPIDRHHSLMRMQERNGRTPGFVQRNFLSTIDNKFSWNMADYASHVEALRGVFSESELYTGYYETLFTGAEIARICDFLGLALEPAAYATRLNTSEVAHELDPELVGAARAKFAATYDYCRRNFPGLPRSWRT